MIPIIGMIFDNKLELIELIFLKQEILASH